MSRVEKIVLSRREHWVLYLINFARMVVTFVLLFKFPLLFEDLGFSGDKRGLIFCATPVCGLLSTFWFGVFSDRVDARLVMFLGFLLLCLFLFGVSVATHWLSFLFLFALSGLAGQMFTLGSNAYFFKTIGRELDSEVFISRYSAASSFGIFAGFMAGPLLVSVSSLSFVAVATGLMGMCFSLLVFLLRPARVHRQNVLGYFQAFRNSGVLIFAVLIFLFTLHWGTEMTCYSPFLKKNLSIPESYMGLFMGPPIFALGCSTLFFGHLAGRIGPRVTLASAFFFSGLGVVAMVMSSSPYTAFAWRLVHEIGDGAFFLFMLGGIHRLFSEELAGGSAGLVWFIAMAAQGVSAFISAPLGEAYGYAMPQAAAGLLSLIATAGIFVLKKAGR